MKWMIDTFLNQVVPPTNFNSICEDIFTGTMWFFFGGGAVSIRCQSPSLLFFLVKANLAFKVVYYLIVLEMWGLRYQRRNQEEPIEDWALVFSDLLLLHV